MPVSSCEPTPVQNEGMGEDDDASSETLDARVEISITRSGREQPQLYEFRSNQTGILKLGPYVDDVEISAPLANVEVGPGPEAILVAPVVIQCGRLTFTCRKVVAELPTSGRDNAVALEAEENNGQMIDAVPSVRGSAQLTACWPNARMFPWTAFAVQQTKSDDPRLNEALRRFRKFIISFRSHKKGSLARYRAKLEHERMTKGTGGAVLLLLKETGIVQLQGAMYHLDADKLGEVAGATYIECASKKFSEKTQKFVSTIFGYS